MRKALVLLLVPMVVRFVRPRPLGFVKPRSSTSTYTERLGITWETTAEGQQLHADVRIPADGATKRPLLIVLPGGGFVSADLPGMAPPAREFAARGFVTMTTDYSFQRKGETREQYLPRPVRDVGDAIAWAVADPLGLGMAVDPARVGILGASARGTIGTIRSANDRQIDAMVSWSGPWSQVTFSRVPPPRFACHAVNDSRAPYLGEVDTKLAWENAGGRTDLYDPPDDVHGIQFWTYKDTLGRTVCRSTTISWIEAKV
ncbi:MAG: alpha/beta hydrolase family protein [Actinomycetota bacterium]